MYVFWDHFETLIKKFSFQGCDRCLKALNESGLEKGGTLQGANSTNNVTKVQFHMKYCPILHVRLSFNSAL